MSHDPAPPSDSPPSISLTRDDETLISGDEDPAGAPLERGATLGRYTIIDEVGTGAMGVVFTAYDPDLDRRLAIKVLRPRRGARRGASRLLREARALAKLSHPNVVAIHDVGLVDGRVFVAMDYIEGHNLHEWVVAQKRTWRDIVRVYLSAGRGLAAAHAVGLVHRDFKPANVLVGKDGRPRVLDFGLARATETADTSGPYAAVETGEHDMRRSGSFPGLQLDGLTREGAVVGTPAYMAPEQHAGAAVNAEADQFSFCVSLYEALWGRSPYAGDTLPERAMNVLNGQMRDPPRSEVPGYVFTVLRRGLSPEPESRYPNMAELLDALERDPARKRRKWLGAAAVVGGLAATFALARASTPASTVGSECARSADALQDAWSPERRTEVEAAFGSIELSYVDKTRSAVLDELDGYAESWRQTARDNCEATNVRQQQSAELLDLRAACLDDRRRQLDALTQVLADADQSTVENAVSAVRGLPDIEACSDLVALRTGIPTPTDPATIEAIDALETRVAQAHAEVLAGRYSLAAEHAKEVEALAAGIEHPPALARAWAVVGEALEANGEPEPAEEAFVKALVAAERSRDAEAIARIRLMLGKTVGDRLARFREGHTWLDLADASIEHAGSSPELRAELETGRALILDHEGEYKRALEHEELALELLEAAGNPDPLVLGGVHNNLAGSHARLRNHEAGLRHAETAISLWSNALGADHPRVAVGYATLSLVHDYHGDYDQTLPPLERALAILEAALGPDNLRVAELTNNLAIVHVNRGDLDESEAQFRRTLEIRERALGPDHIEVASAVGNLGSLVRMRGRTGEAIELQRRAIAIREAVHGADHPELAMSLGGLANALEETGELEEALELRHRVIAAIEKSYGPENPAIVVDLGNLAYTLTRMGRASEAVGFAERAVRIVDTEDTKPDVEAFARIALGNALVASGRRGERARQLAEHALDDLGDLKAEPERELLRELAKQAKWQLAVDPLGADK